MKKLLTLLVFSIAMIGSVSALADDMPEGINLKVGAPVTVEDGREVPTVESEGLTSVDGRDLPTVVQCDDMCH